MYMSSVRQPATLQPASGLSYNTKESIEELASLPGGGSGDNLAAATPAALSPLAPPVTVGGCRQAKPARRMAAAGFPRRVACGFGPGRSSTPGCGWAAAGPLAGAGKPGRRRLGYRSGFPYKLDQFSSSIMKCQSSWPSDEVLSKKSHNCLSSSIILHCRIVVRNNL